MTSLFLTAKLAQEAVGTVLPAITELMNFRAKRAHMHIVILDPTKKPWNSTFEEAIVYEYQIGNPEEWEYDYKNVARSKAEQSFRTGLPNGIMHLHAPVLIESGDTKWTSSYVDSISGMIVACSGVQGYFDYLVGGWVALTCLQFAYDESEEVHQNSCRDRFE